jgi:sterol desaturase/sphingolipid hydroxylase (fatty acid hydroxylase superfamily)
MNPILMYFVTLAVVFGGFYLLIYREAQKVGGLKPWLMDLPTTNFRIFISIILAIVFVVSVLLLTIIHAMNPEDVRPLPDVVLDTIGMFIFGMMGLDVVSYLGKRLTHKPRGDDDVPPGATGTMPAPGAMQVKTSGPAEVNVGPPMPSGQ